MKAGTLILLIIVILWLAWYAGFIKIPAGTSVQPIPTPVEKPSEGVAVTKPLKITVFDKFAGSAVSSATVKVYQGQILMESLTTDANGQVTTARAYKSGTQLNILVEKDNSKQWYILTVPYMSEVDAKTLDYNPIELEFWTLGTYTVKVMDQFGNIYTDGGVLNFTSGGALEGVDKLTLNIQIFNSVDNTGYKSSRDPIDGYNWEAWVVMTTTEPNVIFSGHQIYTERGTSRYWLIKVPDEGLIRWKIGSTYKYDGVYSIPVTLDVSGVPSGTEATLTITLYAYADGQKFVSVGTLGPDAVTLAQISLTIAK